LEEVEGILIADENVYEGRKLHEELKVDNEEINRIETFEYTSETLGLTGRVDRLQKRDGNWIPYEHKKGRSRTNGKEHEAWAPDIHQVIGYVLLIEEASGRKIEEARIKYHKDNVLIKIPVTEELREKVKEIIKKAKDLMTQIHRPPVAENPNVCIRCSLASVCLPEENRVITEEGYHPIRLFPPNREKQSIHVMGYQSSIHKSGEFLQIEKRNSGGETEHFKVSLNEIDSVNIHGTCQISAQLIYTLASNNIPIHWFTGGGNYIGGLNFNSSNVQRKIRQYEALVDTQFKLYLTKQLVLAKCETQFKYLLRASRKKERTEGQTESIEKIRNLLKEIPRANSIDSIRGYEGMIAKIYFENVPSLLKETVPQEMIPNGRSKRPPKDRYNAILSFMYGLLYRSVWQAIISVGLESSLGFYHTPRSAAEPLVLDLMELFRVPICDIPLIGSVNRLSWDPVNDFEITKEKVWMSDSGKKKAIKLYEERLNDTWKHPITDYSLSYYRMIELEVRLLEKEWSDKAGLFAKARLR
jgi:CRISPR-associated protein Cas1